MQTLSGFKDPKVAYIAVSGKNLPVLQHVSELLKIACTGFGIMTNDF